MVNDEDTDTRVRQALTHHLLCSESIIYLVHIIVVIQCEHVRGCVVLLVCSPAHGGPTMHTACTSLRVWT